MQEYSGTFFLLFFFERKFKKAQRSHRAEIDVAQRVKQPSQSRGTASQQRRLVLNSWRNFIKKKTAAAVWGTAAPPQSFTDATQPSQLQPHT